MERREAVLVDEVYVEVVGEEELPDLCPVVSDRPSERPALVTVDISPGLQTEPGGLCVPCLAGGEQLEVVHDTGSSGVVAET